ncbi:MAG: hypothetical protein ACR652_17940 [Methylocystis sp.]|uniref:hypothetical protein n=1 Tax=Methylocystis sp. TaxID=1911079 RepID=UPI003DA5474F
MHENQGATVSLSRETASLFLDPFSRPEDGPTADKNKNTVCVAIRAALRVPQQACLESVKEEARVSLAQSTEMLAQAQRTLADALDHGTKVDQHTASTVVSARETRVRGSQAAYEAAVGEVLDAAAQGAEGERRIAYAKSQKAHDEALAALQGYEPLAQEISKLFRILSFHADLAMADVEAADAARISPHVANAADHLEKLIQEQKLGHADTVTKHALAALHELAAHVRG